MNDTTVRLPVKWNCYGNTHVGTVRKINEDSILNKSDLCLWAVADGMGGYEAGDFASSTIIKTLSETENIQNLYDMSNSVEVSLQNVNQQILEYSNLKLNGRMSGSTVVCLIIRDNQGVCLWAGDSRLYHFRNQQLEQISLDHSYVETLLRQGLISKDEAKNHPDTNVITRAIGARPNILIDKHSFNVMLGDTFLLCSDGLYNAVSDEDFVYFLKNFNAQECVEGLISMALKNGASDNVSVIVLKSERDMAEKKHDSLNDEI